MYRVAEKIRSAIALELQRTADPRLELVTVTSVMVTPDLREAKVYYMVYNHAQRRTEVDEAFEGAEGMFRRIVARELDLRFAPALKFFYDDSLDVQDEVGRLLARTQAQGES